MYSRSVCMAMFLIAGFAADAQQGTKERGGGIVGLGVGFGYENVRGNPGIQGQLVTSGMADVTLGPRTFLSCRLGFSQTAREYTGNAKSTLQDLHWKDLSLTTAVFQRVSSIGSLGLGAGIDWIDFSGDEVEYPQRVSVGSDGTLTGPAVTRRSIAWKDAGPSVSALASVEFVMPQGARIVILCTMKFSFIGHPRGDVRYYLVQTAGVSVAFMRDVVE
jgi:hypothetical protein